MEVAVASIAMETLEVRRAFFSAKQNKMEIALWPKNNFEQKGGRTTRKDTFLFPVHCKRKKF